MSSPRKIEVYQCGSCKSLRRTEEEALACCNCACGAPIPGSRRSFGSDQCDRCSLKGRIISARAEVKRHQERLAETEKRLAGLLAEKEQYAADRKAT